MSESIELLKRQIDLLEQIHDILFELSLDWHAEHGINKRQLTKGDKH